MNAEWVIKALKSLKLFSKVESSSMLKKKSVIEKIFLAILSNLGDRENSLNKGLAKIVSWNFKVNLDAVLSFPYFVCVAFTFWF